MPSTTDGEQPQYVTVEEAARLLAVDNRTVRRWITSGRLPAYKAGNRLVRIRVADLDVVLTPIANGGAA